MAIRPADVTLTQGMNTIVYAWGSAEGNNLTLAVQQVAIGGGKGMPDTGVANADSGFNMPLALGILSIAALGVVVTGRKVASVRS